MQVHLLDAQVQKMHLEHHTATQQIQHANQALGELRIQHALELRQQADRHLVVCTWNVDP